MTNEQFKEVNEKLDLIIDAFNLGKTRRKSPIESKIEADRIVHNFRKKHYGSGKSPAGAYPPDAARGSKKHS